MRIQSVAVSVRLNVAFRCSAQGHSVWRQEFLNNRRWLARVMQWRALQASPRGAAPLGAVPALARLGTLTAALARLGTGGTGNSRSRTWHTPQPKGASCTDAAVAANAARMQELLADTAELPGPAHSCLIFAPLPWQQTSAVCSNLPPGHTRAQWRAATQGAQKPPRYPTLAGGRELV
jgi:hypothetical protein